MLDFLLVSRMLHWENIILWFQNLGDKLSVIVPQLLNGLVVTAEIFILTLLFSLPLGMLVALVRKSKIGVLRGIVKLYISIMRGTPLMLQLMVIYFGPYYLFGINLSSEYRFIAVIIGFALNYAAYFAEIYRAGIESIPKGQYEAGAVLGFTKGQVFFKIVLPQVIKRILPPVTNEVITLVKDTSLAMSISITEMFVTAKDLASAQASMLPFLVAGVFFFVMNYVVAWIMEMFEKKLSYYN